MHAVLPQPMAGLGRQRVPAGKLGIGLSSPGSTASGMLSGATGAGDLLQPIRPVAAAAEQAQDHQARLGDHLLDIEIDRHRVAELEQVGEPQARRVRRAAGLGRGQAGELGIGRREKDDVARALREVDRLAGIVRRGGPRVEQMHDASGSAEQGRLDRALVERALADHHEPAGARLVAAPGAIEVVLHAVADALEHQAHRLAGDRGEALDPQDRVARDHALQPVDERLRVVERRQARRGSS